MTSSRSTRWAARSPGPITSVADFGVFVRLEEGVDGLVYSSELAEERIETPAEHFKDRSRRSRPWS